MCGDGDGQIQKVFEKIDQLSQFILNKREQNVQLDMKRQGNREALAEINKPQYNHQLAASGMNSGPAEKTLQKSLFYLSGSLFVKFPKNTVEKLIRSEQDYIDAEIKANTKLLKEKMLELMSFEGRADEVEAFDLSPLK